MARQSFSRRLASGENILLDGGTGSELQRRGVNIARGWNEKGDIGPWSAVANKSAPEVVRKVHADYLQQGADVITTNSFWSSRSKMGVAGLASEWEEYTRRAGEIAIEARDTFNPDAYVVAGISPPAGPDSYEDLKAQAEVLAKVGVDAMLTEYVGTVENALHAARAVAETGLPVLLGIHYFTESGRLKADGSSMEDLVNALRDRDLRVDAILLMCDFPQNISRTLPGLREAFDGPIGAYANIGYVMTPDSTGDDPYRQLRAVDIEDNTPERYARFGRQWLDMGAQIVGGCCATTPDHIAALRPVVKGARSPVDKVVCKGT